MSFEPGLARLDFRQLASLAKQPRPELRLMPQAKERVDRYRAKVEDLLRNQKTTYGINTGFGLLADVKIAPDQLSQLQVNLIRSHACGVGEALSAVETRALMVLRLHTFLLGHGGISWPVCELIANMIDHDILPVIPSKGSVGASGDLAPLSHLALSVMGEGEVVYEGQRMPTMQAFQRCQIRPVTLGPKEGLSITNGTQFMSARAAILCQQAEYLLESADYIAAISLDAFKGTKRAFDPRIHELKGQRGQIKVAKILNQIFADGDEMMESHRDCGKVQDPYSFRCIPQVHGASRDAFAFVADIVNRELNAVSDNPLIMDDGDLISGGNFHGQAIAMALDFLGIAMAEIGSISEQRTMKLTNPTMSGLPAFLIQDSGLNSGMMIPHVVAASLVSENKILAHPAVVDSIPTSADKEDHVSMGPVAAQKASIILKNISHILAVELIAGCQGADLHRPSRMAKPLEDIHQAVRVMCPFMDRDLSLAKPIEDISAWLLSGGVQNLLVSQGFDIRLKEECSV